MGIGNGLALRVEQLEDGLQARHGEDLVECGRHGADPQRAGRILCTREIAHQHAQTGAVDEGHAAEVQQDVRIHSHSRIEVRLKGRTLLTFDDSPGTGHDGDVADIAAVKRQRHSGDAV